MARRFTDKKIIDALTEAHGLVSIAAKSLDCHPDLIYKRMRDSSDIRHALEVARDSMTDTAESSLFNAVKGGESWAVCFYLKTQGKSRGYVERQEMTGAGGTPIAVEVDDVTRLTSTQRADRFASLLNTVRARGNVSDPPGGISGDVAATLPEQ